MELSSLMYLLRQGIAIIGHEEIQGNLYQLMKLRLNDIGINDFDTTYMSPEIVNELISMMGHAILCGLMSEMQEAKFYSVLCDETADITN